MDLILWRHAEAEDGAPDLARRLTPKGEAQAQKVALWLQARLPKDTRLLASPAERTQQTARALAQAAKLRLQTVDPLAPGASIADVLGAADWPNVDGAVVVVGHQPTIGWVASHLLSGRSQYWSIKKGGAWWFGARERDGELRVQLRAVVNPDLL
jgi:phosphohistidine phosphatase